MISNDQKNFEKKNHENNQEYIDLVTKFLP